MSLRKAILDVNGLCHNVIAVPDDWVEGDANSWQPPEGYSLVDAGTRGQIGAVYVNGAFVDPEAPEPPAPTGIEKDIAALKAGFQALVDEKVIPKDKLPPDLKGDITAATVDEIVP